jgi:hypothetical protein
MRFGSIWIGIDYFYERGNEPPYSIQDTDVLKK